jgi:hypothetical protein
MWRGNGRRPSSKPAGGEQLHVVRVGEVHHVHLG